MWLARSADPMDHSTPSPQEIILEGNALGAELATCMGGVSVTKLIEGDEAATNLGVKVRGC